MRPAGAKPTKARSRRVFCLMMIGPRKGTRKISMDGAEEQKWGKINHGIHGKKTENDRQRSAQTFVTRGRNGSLWANSGQSAHPKRLRTHGIVRSIPNCFRVFRVSRGYNSPG